LNSAELLNAYKISTIRQCFDVVSGGCSRARENLLICATAFLFAQLKRYLSDRRRGCDEGLLITFDKTLPNGLSATRVTRVTDRVASQLYRPSNARVFMSQPLHHLESDPFAVGVMVGICRGYGIELTQDCD
jgi:hypothetical protein